MTKMQELYEKVANDGTLQEKFLETMKDAENNGEDSIMEKLSDFAKSAGFEVTAFEIQEFFKNLSEPENGELSDHDLDMVAGGKGLKSTLVSVFGIGIGCSVSSVLVEVTAGDCNLFYKE